MTDRLSKVSYCWASFLWPLGVIFDKDLATFLAMQSVNGDDRMLLCMCCSFVFLVIFCYLRF